MPQTKIVVTLKDKTPASALHQMRRLGVDVCELRIDSFSSSKTPYVLKEISKIKNIPVLATIRCRAEGGRWKGPESRRLELYRAVIPRVNMVDIELSSKTIAKDVVLAAKNSKKTVIISYHNFKSTPSPEKLHAVLQDAKRLGADIVKIAAMARSHRDVQTLLNFTKANAKINIVTISMGPKGAISRILFPRFGSRMTYASLDQPMAPGQMNYQTMLKLLGR